MSPGLACFLLSPFPASSPTGRAPKGANYSQTVSRPLQGEAETERQAAVGVSDTKRRGLGNTKPFGRERRPAGTARATKHSRGGSYRARGEQERQACEECGGRPVGGQQERQTCEESWGGVRRGPKHEQHSCEEGDIALWESNSGKAPAGAARDPEGQTSTKGGIRQQTEEPGRSNIVWEEREHTRAISAERHRPRGRIASNSAEVGVGVACSRHVRMRKC